MQGQGRGGVGGGRHQPASTWGKKAAACTCRRHNRQINTVDYEPCHKVGLKIESSWFWDIRRILLLRYEGKRHCEEVLTSKAEQSLPVAFDAGEQICQANPTDAADGSSDNLLRQQLPKATWQS